MEFSAINLTCLRGGTAILADVSFRVAAGEALILRGSNGAGKTTLLRTIAGLTPAAAGEMSFGADDVAYSAHADGLKAQLTVAENLNFWAHVYGASQIQSAVDTFELSSLLDRQTGYLSAGQKRRLSLSRLMLSNRPIWALDEPTVSLDAHNVSRFASAVSSHLVNGGSAIIATHIELGLPSALELDIGQFRAYPNPIADDPFLDEAFQ